MLRDFKVFIVTAFGVAALCILLYTISSAAEPTPAQPGRLPLIDSKIQMAIIDSITTALNRAYVFADLAARMDSLLDAKSAGGAYRDLKDPVDFVATILADVNSVYLDRHMDMRALLPEQPGAPEPVANPREAEEFKERMRKMNYGFRRIEILPGNIGYLELTQFMGTENAGETAVGAMNVLANADAIIIDLRRNGGGNADMIQLLTGYFLKESEHLVSWYSREKDTTQQSWSLPYVPGKRMYDTPLFILSSNFTGSAAEEFAYDLKNLKRATIVGETTGGAAHTVQFGIFDFDTFRVALKLPSGRAISPITNTNWEGKGVEPDIAVSADKALITARLEALKVLAEKATDESTKNSLVWARTGLESELNPVSLSVKELRQYVGTFGPRAFFIEGNVLMYEREGRPKRKIAAMGRDLFGLEDADYFRIRFTRDAKGVVDGVIGMYDNGRQERNPRKK